MFDQTNLSKLENLFPTQRWGRPRYARTAMLAAVLVLYLRGLGSYRYLSDFLAKDHFWARKCGFEDRTPDQSSFSRFLSLLDDRVLDTINGILVEEVRRAGVIGDKWAVDSTFLEASFKDPDANWGWDDTYEKYIWGFKIHTIVDAESELPIQMLLSPAKGADCNHALPLVFGHVTTSPIVSDKDWSASERQTRIQQRRSTEEVQQEEQECSEGLDCSRRLRCQGRWKTVRRRR